MTHGSKVVNFIGLNVGNNCDKIGGITKISIVKKELYTSVVTVTVDVVDTASVEGRTTTDDSVDLEHKRWSVEEVYESIKTNHITRL
jgi:hypothetical protein